MSDRECSVGGCGNASRCRGYCSMHYTRWARHGVTDRVAEQPHRIEARFWRQVDRGADEECWTWKKPAYHGYGRFSVGRRGCEEHAHRFSWMLTNGPIPDGLFVRHKCDNRPCVNPRHLELGTHDDNMRDMAERGRTANRKLTNHDVSEIRRFYARGVGRIQLAAAYGISKTNLQGIVTGNTWKHVEVKENN